MKTKIARQDLLPILTDVILFCGDNFHIYQNKYDQDVSNYVSAGFFKQLFMSDPKYPLSTNTNKVQMNIWRAKLRIAKDMFIMASNLPVQYFELTEDDMVFLAKNNGVDVELPL